MNREEIIRWKMNREEIIDRIVDRYYFVPSKFNLLGRISFFLSGNPTKEQFKKQLKKELIDEKAVSE